MTIWDRLWEVLGAYSIIMFLTYLENKKRHKAEIENMELRFKLFKEQKENELKEANGRN